MQNSGINVAFDCTFSIRNEKKNERTAGGEKELEEWINRRG